MICDWSYFFHDGEMTECDREATTVLLQTDVFRDGYGREDYQSHHVASCDAHKDEFPNAEELPPEEVVVLLVMGG